MSANTAPSRPNYGIDAPDVVWRFLTIGIIGVCLGAVPPLILRTGKLPSLRFAFWPLLTMGFSFLFSGCVMLWGSKVGKLRLRDKVLNAFPWRGDERVLDVGCGHGLMLIGAAKRLRKGRAVGIDLWKEEDQAGNSREATWLNVQLEGVADRVELKDGDARKLPFPDASFDLIVSSWAVHNIYSSAERDQAVREMVRTLKPGGRVTIIDIRHTAEYADVLRSSGMTEVKRSLPSFIFVIPTVVLTAMKLGR